MNFVNEPLLELRRASVRADALAALERLDSRLPLEVPVTVGGERAEAEVLQSLDPSRPETVVAIAGKADGDHVDAAVAAATAARAEWSGRSAGERAAVLERAAGGMRARRLELAALIVRECAKPWPEADADVCEAIDFLEYYARGAYALGRGAELTQLPGERNTMRYAPRGVVAVLAPWNFPIAIVTGMTSAALAAGNTVLLKPAEQAPGCAAAVVDTLHAAGVPLGALSLLPGGDEPGAALVAHDDVDAIAFTGSCAVGLEIMRQAAIVAPGQTHLKRVIAEMGGKNCMVVDSDADLDDAVPALVASAFAFAGQKCSAASRVLAHEAIADELAERLAGAVASLRVGPAEDFETEVPPVIDAEAQARVRGYMETGDATARRLAHVDDLPGLGYHVGAAVYSDLPPDSPLIVEEIFGPVLTLERVADVDAACDLVDASRFALTGGLFSRSPATIERVARRTPVGNLYINRATTGAMVGRQPFGGNRLSGTGSQAGGPDYLLQFVEPRVVTENTVRHGLVV
jgi:RHH-type proline utilization regulon transcriptional repressor/proline dehydrogenase/delta 1-pyrroline-5-carboxylate dehydrogenase